MKKLRSLFALFLALVMTVSTFPFGVFAAETEDVELSVGQTVEGSVSGTETITYALSILQKGVYDVRLLGDSQDVIFSVLGTLPEMQTYYRLTAGTHRIRVSVAKGGTGGSFSLCVNPTMESGYVYLSEPRLTMLSGTTEILYAFWDSTSSYGGEITFESTDGLTVISSAYYEKEDSRGFAATVRADSVGTHTLTATDALGHRAEATVTVLDYASQELVSGVPNSGSVTGEQKIPFYFKAAKNGYVTLWSLVDNANFGHYYDLIDMETGETVIPDYRGYYAVRSGVDYRVLLMVFGPWDETSAYSLTMDQVALPQSIVFDMGGSSVTSLGTGALLAHWEPETFFEETVTCTSSDPEIVEVFDTSLSIGENGNTDILISYEAKAYGTVTLTLSAGATGITGQTLLRVRSSSDLTLGETLTDVAYQSATLEFGFTAPEAGIYTLTSATTVTNPDQHWLNLENKSQYMNTANLFGEECANATVRFRANAGDVFTGSLSAEGEVRLLWQKEAPLTRGSQASFSFRQNAYTEYALSSATGETVLVTVTFRDPDPMQSAAIFDPSGSMHLPKNGSTIRFLQPIQKDEILFLQINGNLQGAGTVTVTEAPKLALDTPVGLSSSWDQEEHFLTFTPTVDGMYDFTFTDPSGRGMAELRDGEKTLLNAHVGMGGSSLTSSLDLTAGKTYTVKCWGTTSLTVQVKKGLSPTAIKIDTLPYRLEYIKGFVPDMPELDGLTATITWENTTTTSWTPYSDGASAVRTSFDPETGVVTLTIGKVSATFTITYIENPVSRIELAEKTELLFAENQNGYLDENETFIYYEPQDFRLKLRIHYKNGSRRIVTVYSTSYPIDSYYAEWDSGQSEKPWVLGKNESTLTYLGHSVTVPVNVVQLNLDSVAVEGDNLTLYENGMGYYTDRFNPDSGQMEKFFFYALTDEILSSIKVRITKEGGSYEIFSLTDKPYGFSFTTNIDQHGTPWVLGSENYIFASYLGTDFVIPVNIIPTKVTGIEVITLPTEPVYYGDLAHGEMFPPSETDPNSSYELMGDYFDGLVVRVHLSDSTYKDYSYEELQELNFRVEGGDLWIERSSYETPVEIGVPLPHRVTLFGQTASFTVTPADGGLKTIEITKLPENTNVLFVGHDYDCCPHFFSDFRGMEVTLTFQDNSKKVITVNEENLYRRDFNMYYQFSYEVREKDCPVFTICCPETGRDELYIACLGKIVDFGSLFDAVPMAKPIDSIENLSLKVKDLPAAKEGDEWSEDVLEGALRIHYTDTTTRDITIGLLEDLYYDSYNETYHVHFRADGVIMNGVLAIEEGPHGETGYRLTLFESDEVVIMDVEDHTFSKWQDKDDTTHIRTCLCGETETAPHDFSEPTVTVEPTVGQAGEKTYRCPACGHIKTETIPAIEATDRITTTDGSASLTVPEGSSAKIDKDAVLSVEPLTKDENEALQEAAKESLALVVGENFSLAQSFDVAIFMDDAKVQPGGKVLITLPDAPAGYEDLTVVYIDDLGVVTPCETIHHPDGSLSFYADHFSTYALAGKATYLTGDMDGSGSVDSDDAIYLLFYTLFEEDYPITQPADFDGSGEVDSDDAIYLLFHTLFEEDYPL